ncbi:hypothetical protein DTL42_09950 [Bremerella cremea]|uniref:PsbP C-terminal domain-containing protein n=1 Tax=Bremerella cremea TaxID=1031537 RepID=A0A368KSK5_9BACT|nr:hypothetical protein [Bremerella cremea]RCS51873.1 hypothetical protein DTL42_09950 [Bremerella cremea]
MKQFAPLCFGLVLLTSVCAQAAEEKEAKTISFGEGHFEMTVPEGWKTVQPKVRIIDHEFSAPAKEKDATPGRATLMGAGGGVDANIARWKGQFSKLTSDEVKEEKIAGQKVHFVELKGDFKDQRGPFAPAETKKDYTVLGAIITTDKLGDYFLKFYGPSETIEQNKEKFTEMVNSLKVK